MAIESVVTTRFQLELIGVVVRVLSVKKKIEGSNLNTKRTRTL
jgi:hypothetical protein